MKKLIITFLFDLVSIILLMCLLFVLNNKINLTNLVNYFIGLGYFLFMGFLSSLIFTKKKILFSTINCILVMVILILLQSNGNINIVKIIAFTLSATLGSIIGKLLTK